MMNKLKYFFIIVLLFFSSVTTGYKKPPVITIDAVNNANMHNNLGLLYLEDRIYYAAIQEFKIAISLNPNSQTSATYYNNLGKTYLIIGYPDLAQDCFERAISQYPLDFSFYDNLAQTYLLMNIAQVKLRHYSKSDLYPQNRIMSGLLNVKLGNIKQGIIILDEFCSKEPDLKLTPGVKKYIESIQVP